MRLRWSGKCSALCGGHGSIMRLQQGGYASGMRWCCSAGKRSRDSCRHLRALAEAFFIGFLPIRSVYYNVRLLLHPCLSQAPRCETQSSTCRQCVVCVLSSGSKLTTGRRLGTENGLAIVRDVQEAIFVLLLLIDL